MRFWVRDKVELGGWGILWGFILLKGVLDIKYLNLFNLACEIEVDLK